MWNGLYLPLFEQRSAASAAGISSVLAGNNVFVSSTGNDATGQRQNFAKQFLTLESAITAAKAGAASSYTIWVLDGTHTVTGIMNDNSVGGKILNYIVFPNAVITQSGALGSYIINMTRGEINICAMLGSVLNFQSMFFNGGDVVFNLSFDVLNSPNIFLDNVFGFQSYSEINIKGNKLTGVNDLFNFSSLVGNVGTLLIDVSQISNPGPMNFLGGGEVKFVNSKIIRNGSDTILVAGGTNCSRNIIFDNCDIGVDSFTIGSGAGVYSGDMYFKNTTIMTDDISFDFGNSATYIFDFINKIIASSANSLNNGVGTQTVKIQGTLNTNKPFNGLFTFPITGGLINIDTDIE